MPNWSPEELHEPEFDPEDIINVLWNKPGMSWKDLHTHFGVKTIGQHRGFSRAADTLLYADRLLIVRFTTYAPSLRTEFCLFPVEKGRLEVVDEDGISFCYTLDRHGKWDELMEEALRNA